MKSLALLALLIALLLPLSAYALFGTVVTPFKIDVQVLKQRSGLPLPDYAIALHDGNPGAEPFWPWQHRYRSDIQGRIEPVVFTRIGGGSVFSKRLRETQVLLAINSDSGVRYFALQINAARKTRIRCLSNAKNDPGDLVYRRNSVADCAGIKASASSEKVQIDGKPGWHVRVRLDVAE
jgi:hypothetical protein